MRKDTVSDSEYSSCESESDVSSNPNDSEIEGLVKSKNCSHERKEREAKKGEKSALMDEISQEFDIKCIAHLLHGSCHCVHIVLQQFNWVSLC
jgi:hypothetical protein